MNERDNMPEIKPEIGPEIAPRAGVDPDLARKPGWTATGGRVQRLQRGGGQIAVRGPVERVQRGAGQIAVREQAAVREARTAPRQDRPPSRESRERT